MKAFLLVTFLCLQRSYGYEDKIEVKEKEAAGAPKGDVLVQRITTPTIHASQLFWNDPTQTLLFTDVETDEFYTWQYKNGEKKNTYIKEISGEYFTVYIPLQNMQNQYFVGSDNKFRMIIYNPVSKTYNITTPILQILEEGHFIRVGHCDKNGVYYFLTKNMRGDHGNILYKIQNKILIKVEEFKDNDVRDFVFSYDYTKMFAICHYGTVICSFDFDINLGKISNPTTVFNATEKKLHVKMTSIELDSKDKIWVAADQYILVVNQQGDCEKVIETMFDRLTSITFGGYKSKNLIVASKKTDDYNNKQAGSVFLISGMKIQNNPDVSMVW